MSTTLLVIHSYPGGNGCVRRHWRFWKRTGWDILGVETTEGEHHWPEPIPTVRIGINRAFERGSDHLDRRLVDTFRYCLEPQFNHYNDFCIIEYDSLIAHSPPKHTCGLIADLAGGKMPEMSGGFFLHHPWWADRTTAKRIVECGDEMLAKGELENGSPDLFLGWMVEKYGIPFTDSDTFSCSGYDVPGAIDNARKAYRDGVWYIHPVKTRADLHAITR